ncbi:hypothetical protein ADUPG1_000833, partial [Aduncisulcus paluster]
MHEVEHRIADKYRVNIINILIKSYIINAIKYEYSCPIPKDGPNIKSPEYFAIKAVDTSRARNETKEEDGEEYDQSSEAQKMMLGERNVGHFTHISIPFSPASPLKGAYICLEGKGSPTSSHLIFTFTSSKGEITAKKYEFPEKYVCIWYYLPIDLSDIILCEITGKGRYKQYF